jgi:hypothetical protein
MTLSDQLLITIVDKGLLAVLLLFFALWANRALERYKTRQHLLAEVAKRRVERIGLVWDEISKLETLILHIPWRIGSLALEELRRAGAKDIPAAPPEKAADLISLFHPPISLSLPRSFTERVEKEISPLFEEVNVVGEVVSKTISGNRFWLGSELHQGYRTYYAKLMALLPLLDFGSTDNLVFEQTLKSLDSSREQVTTLLDKL